MSSDSWCLFFGLLCFGIKSFILPSYSFFSSRGLTTKTMCLRLWSYYHTRVCLSVSKRREQTNHKFKLWAPEYNKANHKFQFHNFGYTHIFPSKQFGQNAFLRTTNPIPNSRLRSIRIVSRDVIIPRYTFLHENLGWISLLHRSYQVSPVLFRPY